jgi:hypothetical protein
METPVAYCPSKWANTYSLICAVWNKGSTEGDTVGLGVEGFLEGFDGLALGGLDGWEGFALGMLDGRVGLEVGVFDGFLVGPLVVTGIFVWGRNVGFEGFL